MAVSQGVVIVWDGQSGEERHVLRDDTSSIGGCRINGDGQTILSISENETLKAWDGRSGQERWALERDHTKWRRTFKISKDGRKVVSTFGGRMLKVWDGGSGQEQCTLYGHMGPIDDYAISANGYIIFRSLRIRR